MKSISIKDISIKNITTGVAFVLMLVASHGYVAWYTKVQTTERVEAMAVDTFNKQWDAFASDAVNMTKGVYITRHYADVKDRTPIIVTQMDIIKPDSSWGYYPLICYAEDTHVQVINKLVEDMVKDEKKTCTVL